MGKKKVSFRQFTPWIIFSCIMVLVLTVFWSVGQSENQAANPRKPAVEDETDNMEDIPEKISQGDSFIGVVKQVEEDNRTITLLNISNSENVTLFYSGGTEINDKYGNPIVIEQIEYGELVDVIYDKKQNKINKLQISQKGFEYKNIGNFKFDKMNQMLVLPDEKYKYLNQTFFVFGKEEIQMMDLNERDEITIKGIGDTIWSVIVTKGHGYIRLINHEEFIGGMLEVGYGIIVPITENMLVVAREGNYRITLEKDTLISRKNITVLKDRELVIDLVEYQKPAKLISTIDFVIEPPGAELYIDDEQISYHTPLELEYGSYRIKAELDGYTTYNGILKADKPAKTIKISLTLPKEEEEITEEKEEQEQKEQIEEEREKEEEKEEQTEEEEKEKEEKIVDEDHIISIFSPYGVEVYLNGELKGTVPVSFKKEIGTHVLSFRKDGYETKSYTIEVKDDGENASYSFENLKTLK